MDFPGLPDPNARAKRHAIRTEELLAHLAAEYIARTTNGTSLITVTRTEVSSKGDATKIFVSIFPDEAAPQALEFLNRQKDGFREYLKSHARLRNIPRAVFELDYGEKNRQRLDELGRGA
jgi:ribosome-binding factor A